MDHPPYHLARRHRHNHQQSHHHDARQYQDTNRLRGVRPRASRGRVDLGGCPPRSPTDPGLHITRTRFLSYDFAALRNRLWTTRGLGKP